MSKMVDESTRFKLTEWTTPGGLLTQPVIEWEGVWTGSREKVVAAGSIEAMHAARRLLYGG